MKKKKTTKTRNTIGSTAIENGLAEAVGFRGPGNPFSSEQVSQTGTIFKNLRNYMVSNMRQILSEAYVEIGLIQTIVDVPVDDAFRGGVEINSKQLGEEQLMNLKNCIKKEGDLQAVAQARKWTRLFGGGGVIIITDQDPKTPLNLNAINPDTPLALKAVDMWELFYDKQNTDGFDAQFQVKADEFYNYYGKQVHSSRVMKMKGLEAPSFVRPRLRGWGFSVVEKLVRSINQYLKATDLGFEVLDEFKLDVFKIKNLVNTLASPGGDQAVQKRIALANWQKNYQNALVMDVEDEFDHKQLSFAGLAEAMSGIRMQVASDMRMPLTKLFGISAAGFNSGEDDIEVYNTMVENEVRTPAEFEVLKAIEFRCQQLFGFVPDDLSISFKPLRVMTSEQEENVKTQKFTRLLQAKQAGEITRFEFREACNRDTLLSISLDTAEDALNPDDPEIERLVAAGDADDTDTASDVGDEDNKNSKLKDEPLDDDDDASDSEASMLKKNNSIEYDLAAYEASGGDGTFDMRRAPFYGDEKFSDKSLLARAKEVSQKLYAGKNHLPFIVWFYKHSGGNVA